MHAQESATGLGAEAEHGTTFIEEGAFGEKTEKHPRNVQVWGTWHGWARAFGYFLALVVLLCFAIINDVFILVPLDAAADAAAVGPAHKLGTMRRNSYGGSPWGSAGGEAGGSKAADGSGEGNSTEGSGGGSEAAEGSGEEEEGSAKKLREGSEEDRGEENQQQQQQQRAKVEGGAGCQHQTPC